MTDSIENIYSLTPLQKGLLFHEASAPDSRAYYQQLRITLQGRLDTAAFRQAWTTLMQRHAVLRTAFVWDDLDDAYQVVLRDVALPLTEVDLRGQSHRVEALAQADLAAAFDLAQAPLMRLTLARIDDAGDGQAQWVMLWTHHHLLLDGWSVGLLLADWRDLYRAVRRGQAAVLDAVQPFHDFVAHLAERPVDMAFWRERLGDFAATTPLPSMDPRAAAPEGLPVAEHTCTLSAEATARLTIFARAQGLTVNTVLQAAYAYLLGRHAGRDEALIGVTVAGRPDRLAGADRMVGLFINTLPLRVRWDDAPTVGEWLSRLQQANAELREHEHTPLASLRTLTALPPGAELFEAILVFENFPFPRELDRIDDDLAGVPDVDEDLPLRLTNGRNNYPLSLIASLDSQQLQLRLVHQRRRIPDASGARLLDQLRWLLHALAIDAARPLSEVELCPPHEQVLLTQWGDGRLLPLPEKPLHALVQTQARRHPQREAVRDDRGALNYRELMDASQALAAALIARGLQPGDVAALALPRGTEAVVALLGVLQAGGCFLPLDLAQPASRLAAVVAASGARFVIGAPTFHTGGVPVVAVRAGAASESIAMPAVPLDAPAYLIYTSGSTGMPKGVCVSHRAIAAYVHGICDELGLGEDPEQPWRHVLLSTLAADLGYTQLFGALASGGSLLLVDDDTRADPTALARLFTAFPPDLAKLTPGHLQGLLKADSSAVLLPRRALLLGGEALQAETVRAVRALAPALRIYNHYGPTETAVGVTLSHIGAPLSGIQPLGRPQPNRRLRVLDANGRPVAIGMPGELFIGGEGLALGYHADAAQTAQRFFAAADLPRAYRTGDRARWLASGEIAFLGRVDNQVKLRGYRIELGEVEAQVRQAAPAIRQVVARVIQPEGEVARLVAWFVADTSISADKLRSDLALRLPEAMVPAVFVALDALPLNANGKPDLSKLPLPDAPVAATQGFVVPRNEAEAMLAEIWQAVLRIERVGVHDDFFALGGDSILSLQIIARAHQHGLRLTPKQLFDHRNIAQIVAAVLPATASTAPARQQAATVPWLPGQHIHLTAGEPASNWRCVSLTRRPTLEALTQAVQAVQRHHRALQLGLRTSDDGRWQQTLPAVPALARASTHQGGGGEAAARATALFADMDHAGGVGLHACLMDGDGDGDGEGDREAALLLVSHSLRMDEAAWPLLLRDLSLALDQAMHGREIELPRHGGDLAEWAAHQQREATGDAMEPSWEYWLQHAGETLIALPLPAASGLPQRIDLPDTLAGRLQRLQQRLHTPWVRILAAAAAAELADALGQDTVWIALKGGRVERARCPLSSRLARTDFDPSRIVGALSHPVPLRLSVARQASAAELLTSIDAQIAGAPHAGDDHGLLRYMSGNAFMLEPLLALPQPQWAVAVVDEGAGDDMPIGEPLAASPARSPVHALELTLRLRGGRLQLEALGPLAEEWAARVLQRLAALTDAADAVQPAAHAFPLCEGQDLAGLWQDPAFDIAAIEDIYPLSPMQDGMLLHTLLSPDSGIYLMQQRYRWDGPLDREALAWAWHQLLARHPALRTAFWWQDGQPPVQCVFQAPPGLDFAQPAVRGGQGNLGRPGVSLRANDSGFTWYDWRDLDADTQQRQIDAVLAAERRQGFDMRRPPLTRLRVFHLADHRCLIVRAFHHILNDAWCFGLLMSDLFAHYQARVLGQPAARPLLPPYREFIHWLRRQDPARAEDFWRRELAGFEAPTPLVVDQPVPSDHQVEDVGNVDATLTIAETHALDALCRQHQLTPNTWLQGAWALLLARYSGQADVLFGVTVSGRPAELPGVEEIVGLFINSLPLRVAVDDGQPLVPWLQALLAHNLALREHEHTPLVQIQRWSGIERGQALFHSLVVFENAPFDPGLADRRLDFSVDIAEDRVHTNYPVTVVLYPGDRLGIRLSYDAARFDRATMERMLGHLRELLTQMLAQPEASLGQLQMLPRQERDTLLVDWNRSEQAFPLDQTYARLFAQQVARHPERIAAVCGSESLSYAELDRRANRLARALADAGAGIGTLVALAAERGLPLLTMMIGAFKAGAACLPLDVNHPPQRLAQILGLSQASLVLASDGGLPSLDKALNHLSVQPKVLRTQPLWLQGDGTPPPAVGSPADLAYVIFTSGSTGTPKGAMVEQRGMLNNIFGKRPSLDLGPEDRIAQTASPAFDISVWQFLAAPVLGATVHILPDEVAHDPARLLQAVVEEGITILEAVPSMLRALLDVCPEDLVLPHLRWLLPTGEALPPTLARAWLSRFAQVPLMNAYGPAECSDDVAFHPVALPPAGDEPMPIGRPTANNRLYLLDTALRPVPVGVPGEICVAGMGVGRGYLNDPERTRAAFIEHPFEAGERFYRTGDLGRWRADGTIEFLGRRDQQVKVRGHRIELGEIEDRLVQHPAAQAAAVIARPDARGDTQLVGYWVAKTDVEPAALRDWLAVHLPVYMVPAHWVRMEALPLNANGKVDRCALAALDIEAPATATSLAPRTDTEVWLAALWAGLLKLPSVGAEDNFFALGGHSLLATQVVSRIRSHWQVELPLRAVFEYPTLASMARAIDAARAVPAADALLPPITPQPRPARLPLSFAQQRLWFLEQLQPGVSVFNIPFALTLSGPLDVPALQRSLQSLVDRHEALRSTVHSDEGEPWQRVESDVCFDLPVVDLRSSPQPEADAQARLQHLFRRSFDLTHAPLLRAELLRLDDERHRLGVVLHHIAADAWSMALLVDDLAEAYRSHQAGSVPAFEAARLHYVDFALWQRRHLPGAAWQQQLGYWRRQLAGSPPPVTLPSSIDGAAAGDARQAARHRCRLDAVLAKALRQYAKAQGASLFMLLHAALNVLLYQQTGRTDIAIGADVANRHHADMEGLVGFFVNQLVLRSRLVPQQRFDELLAACRDTALEAYQHQDLPFDALVAELLPQRDLRHASLFQIKLVLQNTARRTLALPGLAIDEHELPPQDAELDLLLNVLEEDDGGLLLVYDHDAGRIDAQRMQAMDSFFVALLQAVVESPTASVADLAERLRARHPARGVPEALLSQARRRAVARPLATVSPTDA